MTKRARCLTGLRLSLLLFGFALPVQPCRANASAAFDPAPLEQAAAAGDVKAELQLGTLDYVGIGVVQDYIGAANLLRQAAVAGNAEAQCELGFLYQTGSFAKGPPPPDPKDALPWYEKAAAQGNGFAEFALAEMLQNGEAVTADPVQAAALFAKAAAQGIAPSAATIPLQQLQQHFYALAYAVSGQTQWVDLVSVASGGGQ